MLCSNFFVGSCSDCLSKLFFPYTTARQLISSSDDHMLTIPITRTPPHSHRIFSHWTVKQWNSLFFYICHPPTIKSLKCALKTYHFHEHYYNSAHNANPYNPFFLFYLVCWLVHLLISLCRFMQLAFSPCCLYCLFLSFIICQYCRSSLHYSQDIQVSSCECMLLHELFELHVYYYYKFNCQVIDV